MCEYGQLRVYPYIQTHACTHTVHIQMYAECTHTHPYVHLHTDMYTDTYEYTDTNTDTHTHVHIYKHIASSFKNTYFWLKQNYLPWVTTAFSD